MIKLKELIKDECHCGEACCTINESISDVNDAKKVLQKLMKAEGKFRKHTMKIVDIMEGHTINIQLSKQLKSLYKSKITSFMRDVVDMTRKMK
tara:strand:- start:369 stop:647 length:279 start_codon:yes stop_codon:yes gene_type:complete